MFTVQYGSCRCARVRLDGSKAVRFFSGQTDADIATDVPYSLNHFVHCLHCLTGQPLSKWMPTVQPSMAKHTDPNENRAVFVGECQRTANAVRDEMHALHTLFKAGLHLNRLGLHTRDAYVVYDGVLTWCRQMTLMPSCPFAMSWQPKRLGSALSRCGHDRLQMSLRASAASSASGTRVPRSASSPSTAGRARLRSGA